MKGSFLGSISRKTLWAIVVAIVVIELGGFCGYKIWLLSNEIATLEKQIQTLELSLSLSRDTLAHMKSDNMNLSQELDKDRTQIFSYQYQVKAKTDTITTLNKLTQTDPELLKKYSKVFFLNEHYIPPRLTDIPQPYLYSKNKSLQFLSDAYPYLDKLLTAAAASNTPIQIVSSYRSFGTQAALKSSYKVIYGAGTANQFSADQGYSEHQLGTAVDITASSSGAFTSFDNTPAYAWMTDNAYRFGFILSYPKNNKYYEFEPWHWRFVGVALAQKIHDENKYFYDLDQREIDGYLISIFD